MRKLFARKSVSQIIAEAEGHTLARHLGWFNLINLGIGAIVGAGIFVFTGTVSAQFTGPAIVLSFVIGAFACGLAGLCYAELASAIPVAGSAYTYAYATLGELVAWTIGWDLMLEYALGASSVAVGWSGYFVSMMAHFGWIIPKAWTIAPGSTVNLADGTIVTGIFNLPAACIVLLISAVLLMGIKESARFNNAIVAVKLTVLAIFMAVGFTHIDPANLVPFIPENTGEFGNYGWSGIIRGAGIIFYAYIGFDCVSTAAQEAKNPQRDMPIGILGSLLICTLLFIGVSLALNGVVHYSKLNVPDPIAVAVDAMHMPWLSFLVKIGALTGLSSVIFVLLYGQSRILFTMSSDGLLPQFFRKLHPRFHTPYLTTLAQGVVIAMIAGLVPIHTLGELVSIGTLFAFAIVSAGVLFLHYKEPDMPRGFRVPGMPWTPILSIIVCVYLMSGLPVHTWERLLIWMGLGLGIYAVYGSKRGILKSEQP